MILRRHGFVRGQKTYFFPQVRSPVPRRSGASARRALQGRAQFAAGRNSP
jgi:hypothetical protein